MKLTNYFYLYYFSLKKYFLEIFSSFFVKIYLTIAFILNSFIWLIAFYIYSNISKDLIAMHYNIGLGINLVGSPSQVYILPFLGLIFILVNFIIFILLGRHKDKHFFAHLLFATSLLTNIILILGEGSIYLINFK